MNKNMNKKKKLLIFIVILFLILTLFFFPSCKKKTNIKNEEYIIDETEQGQQFIELQQENENVDWTKEKKKLKGIGKLDIRTFSTITVILFREVKDLKTQLEKKHYSDEQIKTEINKKKDELYNYFGITKDEYNEFYKNNKNEIDNFIASHPSYYSEIEVEEGF